MSDPRPTWLLDYLGRLEIVPLAQGGMARPQPGDLRLADAGDETRLVLVLGQTDTGEQECLLVSVETEYATDQDLLLGVQDTGLPYEVIAETDIVGPVALSAIGPRLGRIDSADLLCSLSDAVLGLGISADLSGRLGLAITQITDPRRIWKAAEGVFIGAAMLSSVEAAATLMVDPSVFLPECAMEEVSARSLFLDVLNGQACMGPQSLRSFFSLALRNGRRSGWMMDAARSLMKSATTASVAEARSHTKSEWTGPERAQVPGSCSLSDLVADIAAVPAQEVRLATCDRLWKTGGPGKLDSVTVRRFGLPTMTVRMIPPPEVLHA